MPGEEPVDEGQRRPHPLCERLVARCSLERVDPHDGVGGARETRHLAAEEIGSPPLPAVGRDDDDGPARQRLSAVLVVELLQRRADPRPAAPVHDLPRHARERRVRVPRREVGGQPVQTRPERERLHAPGLRGRVQEEEQRPCVRRHRPGDVAEDDELAGDDLPRAGRELDELAARAERPAYEPADVEPLPARGGPEAARHPARTDAADLREQARDLLQLRLVEEREVLPAQDLHDRGPARARLSLPWTAVVPVLAARIAAPTRAPEHSMRPCSRARPPRRRAPRRRTRGRRARARRGATRASGAG